MTRRQFELTVEGKMFKIELTIMEKANTVDERGVRLLNQGVTYKFESNRQVVIPRQLAEPFHIAFVHSAFGELKFDRLVPRELLEAGCPELVPGPQRARLEIAGAVDTIHCYVADLEDRYELYRRLQLC